MNLRSPFRRVVASAAILVVVGGLGACGGDDDAAAGDEETTTTTRPTTTEAAGPPAIDQQIEQLLRRYDEVTAEIIADPEIAADRDHTLYRDLGALLVPDTQMTEAVLSSLVQSGQRGEYQLPVEEADVPVERRLDGPVQATSTDEVSFPLCTILQYRRYDAQGRQREILPGLAEPGEGFATRVNGEWRLSRLDTDERSACERGQT